MKVIRSLFTLTCAVLAMFAVLPPAHATPPDVIDIREEPFGVSETHLFVIRTSTDNLGLYESLRVESFLVGIDLETGTEKFWVLDRLAQYRDYSEGGDQLGFVTKRDEGLEAVNPYAVLTDYGAVPWDGVSQIRDHFTKPAMAQDDMAITISYRSEVQFRVTLDELAGKLRDFHAFMAENVADHPRMSTISTRDMFADREIPVTQCSPRGVMDFWSMGHGPVKLLRVVCSLDEDDGVTSLIIPLTAVDRSERG